MSIPKIKKNEDPALYLKRLDEYVIKISKNRYNLLLKFINELFNIKLTALTQFKNIPEVEFMKDYENKNNIVDKYYPEFEKQFNIKFKKNNNTEDNNIEDLKTSKIGKKNNKKSNNKKNKLDIGSDVNNDNNNEDEINKYTICLITRLLKIINYKLSYYTKYDNKYYTIIKS